MLSIIIINHNTKDILKKCLDSVYSESQDLLKQTEVIVVDNGSTDGSLEMVRENYPQVILLENPDNAGFGKANNQAIEIAKGENILLLNSDVEVLENGIEKLLNFYSDLKTPAFIGGKLLEEDLSPQASCGLFYTIPVTFLMLFLGGDRLKITRYSPKRIELVDWVSGACLLGKKSFFEKNGYFDENIFMYMDEIDFLYRAKKRGFKVFFYPDAKFIHLGSGSSQGKEEPVINIYKGLIYFYQKHEMPWKRYLLKNMLKLKALLSMFIGYMTGNQYLKETYSKAQKII